MSDGAETRRYGKVFNEVAEESNVRARTEPGREGALEAHVRSAQKRGQVRREIEPEPLGVSVQAARAA